MRIRTHHILIPLLLPRPDEYNLRTPPFLPLHQLVPLRRLVADFIPQQVADEGGKLLLNLREQICGCRVPVYMAGDFEDGVVCGWWEGEDEGEWEEVEDVESHFYGIFCVCVFVCFTDGRERVGCRESSKGRIRNISRYTRGTT